MADSVHSWKRRLNTAETADYLGISVATVRAWRLRGRDDPNAGPTFVRLSPTMIVYDISELDRWLDSKRAATLTVPA